MEPDFQGYATKANLLCSDGKTIAPNAFQHQDSAQVPLVWQHDHDSPKNVLGHAILENRPDGVWTKAYFNDTLEAQHAKKLVVHRDIKFLSIWANSLRKVAQTVVHGMIREVSLVMAGANPGAMIDPLTIRHSNNGEIWDEEKDDEAFITTGLEIELSHAEGDANKDDADDEIDVEEVYESLTPLQKDVVHYLASVVAEAAKEENAEHSADDKNELHNNDNKEGNNVTHNTFEKKEGQKSDFLSHEDTQAIFKRAQKCGSLKMAMQEYVDEHLEHGITDIEALFPDAVDVTTDGAPSWITRRMEWVEPFLNATRKVPWLKIKSSVADLREDEARAKGYIKGNEKAEQWFTTARRETTPKMIYKKQKLDREDVLSITDFDVVAWIKREMLFMLKEEVARAALVGDGRAFDDIDKIDETKIRPIATDDDFYTVTVNVQLGDANSNYNEVIDRVILERYRLKGAGNPNFYTTEVHIGQFLTLREEDSGRRMYRTLADLAAELRVNAIIPVEVLEQDPTIIGILVNPNDYTFGAVKGGEITNFEDFDIDYNQYKYLSETYLCGALTEPWSAMVIREGAGTNPLVTPAMPAFDPETGELTITDQTGVVYKHGVTTIDAAGSPYTVVAGTPWTVDATPASGYAFPTDQDDEWTFTTEA
jgi:hypothetical protein